MTKKHMTLQDREKLEALYLDGYAVEKIAEKLGFHRATIYNELKRGYWDFMLLIVAAIAAIVYAIFKGNKSVVMSMLYALVSDAEKTLGGGTGPLKLARVIDLVYPKLPIG